MDHGAEAGAARRRLVWTLCAIQFVDVLGVTVVVSTLPDMLADVHASTASGGLVATGYAMFFGGLLLVGARLADRFGHRRVLLFGLGLFAVGAVLAASASTLLVLVAARCVQGAAAAVSVPAALTLLTLLTPDGRGRDKAVAAWSAAGAAAGASGFVVGGIVGQLTSWRWIFAGFVVVAVVLAAAVWAWVPRPDATFSSGGRVQVNAVGGVLVTVAIMAAVVGLTQIAQPGRTVRAAAVLAVSAVSLAAFIMVNRRAPAPLLPARVLVRINLRRGALGGFVNTAATSSAVILVTLYLQDHLHYSPLRTAATLVPFSLLVVAGSTIAGRLLARFPAARVMTVGLLGIAVFDATLSVTVNRGAALAACVSVGGFSLGLSSVAATRLGTSVPAADRGSASGIINTAAQLGTALGTATLVLIAAATYRTPAPTTPTPTAAWLTAAAAAAAAALWLLRTAKPG